MNQEKANKLKARAYALMGQLNEVEIAGRIRKTEEQYVKTAVVKTNLDKYLLHLAKQPSDCSALSKVVILRFWIKEKDMDLSTRLNVK